MYIKAILIILLSVGQIKADCLKADVIILLDISGSVIGYEGVMKKSLNRLVSEFKVNRSDIRIGLISFADGYTLEQSLTDNKRDIKDALEHTLNANRRRQSSMMGQALNKAFHEFNENGRYDAKHIVVIISDADLHDPNFAIQNAEYLQRNEIEIFGLLVENEYITVATMSRLTAGKYYKTSYDELYKDIRRFEICL